MPRCDCAGSTCQCLILAGAGIDITGSGNTNNPYVITATTTIAGSLVVQDTPTIDLTAVGAGTNTDPFILTANATISLGELTDVDATIPAVGDTLSWNGTAWVMTAPPVAPAGAVNTTGGLLGSGALNNPVRVATSGTWGTAPLDNYGQDSTVGQVIYVDSNGQLRAAPLDPQLITVPWDNISGRPSAFPTTWPLVSGKPTTFPTTWNQVTGRPGVAVGSYSIGALAQGAVSLVTVTFPAGRFSGPPIVVAAPGNSYLNVGIDSVTATSARITARNMRTSTTPAGPMFWHAISNPS
jgi:hypothetical protein